MKRGLPTSVAIVLLAFLFVAGQLQSAESQDVSPFFQAIKVGNAADCAAKSKTASWNAGPLEPHPSMVNSNGYCEDQYSQCIDYYCNTLGYPDCQEVCECRYRQCLGQSCL